MKHERDNYGAQIERGKIVSVSGGKCVIKSLTRDGITTPAMTVAGTHAVGDTVYYFMFGDGEGRIIENDFDGNYLKLSGGTMSGTIKLAETGLETNNEAGYSTDKYGNFKHLRDSASDFWNIKNNNGDSVFKVYYEGGNVGLADSGQISKGGNNSTYVSGRDKAIIRNTQNSDATHYYALASAKTVSGSWEIGAYNERFTLTYITDSDYNSQINNFKNYYFSSDGVYTGSANYLAAPHESAYITNQYGHPKHKRSNTSDHWAIRSNDDTEMFQVWYDTGVVTSKGNIAAGSSTVTDPHFTAYSSMKAGTTASANKWDTKYQVLDGDAAQRILWQAVDMTDGRQGMRLGTIRKVSGTTIENHFSMHIDASGKKTVYMTEPKAWFTAMFAQLAASTDLNSLTTPGLYYVGGWDNMRSLVHKPENSDYATLMVLPNVGTSAYCIQYWFGRNGIWRSDYSNSVWSVWTNISTGATVART